MYDKEYTINSMKPLKKQANFIVFVFSHELFDCFEKKIGAVPTKILPDIRL